MEPMQFVLLIREVYRLADDLGIVDLIGGHISSWKPEELKEAQNRLSSLQCRTAAKED